MKLFALFFLCVLLTSCSPREEVALLPPVSEVTYEQGDKTLSGILELDGDTLVFMPHSPEGLRITLDGEGGKAEYKGMVFRGAQNLSALKALYDAIISEEIEEKDSSLPRRLTGKGFILTVNKEIPNEKS